MKVLYFAWLRSQIGKAEETIELPDGIATVDGVLTHLASLGPEYQAALSGDKIVRVAVNQEYAKGDYPVGPDDEFALFPPVTGG